LEKTADVLGSVLVVSDMCISDSIELELKVLADLAVSDPKAFGAIAEQAKSALGSSASASTSA
jgi:ribosomal protein L20